VPDETADETTLPDLLLRLARVLDPVTEKALEAAGPATLTQVAALRQLAEGPASVSDLGRRLGVHRSSASRLVDRLVAAGLATRVASPVSRREVVVACTPQGRRVARAVGQRRSAALAALTSTVPEAEQRRIAAALERLLRHVEHL
jgi:DNA-binding MarR family transcriptional regulator